VPPTGGGGPSPPRLPRKLVLAVALGTPLTPLNSTMIAVALVRIQAQFEVSLAASTWLVSSFYIAACVGQPVLGSLADQLGPRRVFCAGLVLVCLTGAATPFAPSFGWLVVSRVALALGTSAAFPAGLAILRTAAGPGQPIPAAALGALSVAASVSAAIGPVIGGLLVTAAGWSAIFVANVPLTLLGLAVALRWIPRDDRATRTPGAPGILGTVDFGGILLYACALTAALSFLLALGDEVLWPLLPVFLGGGVLFWWHERRVRHPFLDLPMLARDRAMLRVLTSFTAVNVVFYTIYFGLPMWLERIRGLSPAQSGLLVLPISAVAIVLTPLVARYVSRHGPRRPILAGSYLLVVASLALLALRSDTPAGVIAVLAAVLGFPNAFNNFGLQAALYQLAPAALMGRAAGLFQAARYSGAILASVLLGVVYGQTVSAEGFRVLAVVALGVSIGLVLAGSWQGRREPGSGGR
jgi:MFS family permease